MQKNDFLRQLAKEQVIELVECMYEMRARAGQWVIQEGEPGDRLFVVAGITFELFFFAGGIKILCLYSFLMRFCICK